MTCRHEPGDPDCSSTQHLPEYKRGIKDAEQKKRPQETSGAYFSGYQNGIKKFGVIPESDSSNYEIDDVENIGPHLVVRVNYPYCDKCFYEGSKVMVFLNVSIKDALKWKQIDPHFRDPNIKLTTDAPSPAARFPGSKEGWTDAICYAQGKNVE